MATSTIFKTVVSFFSGGMLSKYSQRNISSIVPVLSSSSFSIGTSLLQDMNEHRTKSSNTFLYVIKIF